MGEFSTEDLLDLEIGEALVRIGPAKDSFNLSIPERVLPETDFRDQIVKLSREHYCRPVSEVEKLLLQAEESERLWIVDGEGNVFTENDVVDEGKPSQKRSQQKSEEASKEPASRPSDQSVKHQSSVHKELIDYLEHAAVYPFMAVSERNSELNLSKFRSPNIRKRLEELKWIRQHKVSTRSRSGQITLVEVTESGFEYLTSLRISFQKLRGRGGFLHKYFAHRLKKYAEKIWPGSTAIVEDSSQGRPVEVAVRTPGGRTIAFEVFMTGESKEVKGIVQDVQFFDEVIVCVSNSAALENLKARTA